MHWREHRSGLHACSTGSAGLLAVRADQVGTSGAGGAGGTNVAFAQRCRDFLAGPLATPAGLVGDNVRDGVFESRVWSYNQGLAIGLDVALHQAGVGGALQRAVAFAELTVDHYSSGDRLWSEPPCFVAVLLRLLLALNAVSADRRWTALADGYLDRVWADARQPGGGFGGGGIGAYRRERTLDLAGITIAAAARALSPALAATLC